MSGWMKYPYKECEECEYFDWDKAQDIVNLSEVCRRKDCPVKEVE
ncbi:MAG TPA: hypothetical protein VIK78_14435 [Ruminiclostridium sp.]